MSSVHSNIAQTKGYFVTNSTITDAVSTMFTYNAVAGTMASSGITVPVHTVLKDMGKTVYQPGANGIYRRVQFVTNTADNGVAGSSLYYVRLPDMNANAGRLSFLNYVPNMPGSF